MPPSAKPNKATLGRSGGNGEVAVSAIAELSAKHCIFRSGTGFFALTATSVREVSMAPPLVRIPHAPDSLSGLCHIRSEFVPVIHLASVVGNQQTAGEIQRTSKQLLVLTSSVGPWALLIDQVLAIESVETHVDPTHQNTGHRNEGHLAPILGTASYASHVVRVLNPTALHRVVAQSLDSQWSSLAATKPLLKSTAEAPSR